MTEKKRRSWGEGEVFQPTYRYQGKLLHSKKYWIRYRDSQGKRHAEPAKTTNERVALNMLHERVATARTGVPVGPAVAKTTFEQLEALIRLDYKVNGREQERLERSLTHLEKAFTGVLAAAITEERIERYKAYRLEADASNATINRELSALRRMFGLGARARRIGRIPYMAKLEEDNRRTGFLEPAQFRAIRAHLSPVLQAVADVAYITGWRVASEILTRQWYHVDLGPQVWGCKCGISHRVDAQGQTPAPCAECGKARPGWLRLDPGEGKTKQGRSFPLTPELRAALELQRQRTDALERTVEYQDGKVMPWVFWRMRGAGVGEDGSPIRSWRRAWAAACVLAGLGENIENAKGKKIPHATRIPHDFRRTAVRNLELAGVDRSTAMSLVGHKTEAIYRRYAIVDAAMMQRGASKLSRLHQEQTTTKNVTKFRKRGGESG